MSSHHSQMQNSVKNNQGNSKLLKSLLQFAKDHFLTDLIIESCDSKESKVHLSVLCAVSRTFYAIAKKWSKSKTYQEKCLKVFVDATNMELEALIEYIYTGYLVLDVNDTFKKNILRLLHSLEMDVPNDLESVSLDGEDFENVEIKIIDSNSPVSKGIKRKLHDVYENDLSYEIESLHQNDFAKALITNSNLEELGLDAEDMQFLEIYQTCSNENVENENMENENDNLDMDVNVKPKVKGIGEASLNNCKLFHDEKAKHMQYNIERINENNYYKCDDCNKVVCAHRSCYLSNEEIEYFKTYESGELKECPVKININDKFATPTDEFSDYQYYKKVLIDSSGVNILVFLCDICDIYLIGHERMLEHTNAHKHNDSPSKCPCPFCFLNLTHKHYYEHGRKLHKDQLKTGTQNGTHICDSCGIKFDTDVQLQAHKEFHSMINETAFPDSDSYWKNNSGDPSHKSIMYNCHQCIRVFQGIPELVMHFKEHKSSASEEDSKQPLSQRKMIAEQDESRCEEKSQSKMFHCKTCLSYVCIHRSTPISMQVLQSYLYENKDCILLNYITKEPAEISPLECDVTPAELSKLDTPGIVNKLASFSRVLKWNSTNVSKTIHGCPFCGIYAFSYTSYVPHIATHVKLDRLICLFCEKRFSAMPNLLTHDRKKHQRKCKLGFGSGPYHCQRCNIYFEKEEHIQRHNSNHKNDIVEYRKEFFARADQNEIFKANPGESNEMKLEFRYETNPKTNMRKKSWPCPFCSVSKKRKADLIGHIGIYHDGAASFHCHECGISFKTPEALRLHQNKHKGINYVCTTCGQVYNSMHVLRNHEKTVHSEDRRYSCEICGKSYKANYTLYEHLQNCHANFSLPKGVVSAYECIKCGKFLPNDLMLKIHNRLHEEKEHGNSVIKKIKCRMCDEHFQYRNKRIAHEKAVHGMFPL